MKTKMSACWFIALRCGAGSLLGIGAAGAAAVDAQYGVELGYSRSDNVRRTQTDPVKEGVATAGTDFAITTETRRLNASVEGTARYLVYENSAFDPEFLGSMIADGQVEMVEGHLRWVLQDNFGSARRDPSTEINSPDNVGYVNYFTTGPDASFNFSTRTSLLLQGRYSNIHYSTGRELDQDRMGGGLTLKHKISQSSSIALVTNAEEVRFDELVGQFGGINTDYKQREYFARYELKSTRTEIGIDAGVTQIDFGSGSDNFDLIRLSVARQLGQSVRVKVEAGRNVTDSGNSLRQTQDILGPGLDTEVFLLDGDPFKDDFAGLEVTFDLNRTALRLNGVLHTEDHSSRPVANRDWWIATAALTRRLTNNLSVFVEANYVDTAFVIPGIDFKELHSDAGFEYQLGSRTFVVIGYSRYDRKADVTESEYVENQYWLRFRYGVGKAGRGY